MDSQTPKSRTPMYPKIIDSNPEASAPFISNPSQSSRQPSIYPKIDPRDLDSNLFPQNNPSQTISSPSAPPVPVEEILLIIPGAILHLIDRQYSIDLAAGDLSIFCLRQGNNVVTVFARVSDEIQWPLAKDVAVVKLDDSHYFFSFKFPNENEADFSDEESPRVSKNDSDMILNYGLAFASKGQEKLLRDLDSILENTSNFSIQKVETGKGKGNGIGKQAEVVNGEIAKEFSPADLKSEKKREVMETRCRAYWTTLAPNVEDYSGTAAKLIASGSGQLIKGILWCGDVTVERLNQGNEVLKGKISPSSNAEISPETLKRIKRVKRMTKMSEKVAKGVLSGVVKVSGYFTSSVANSKAGKKFFGLIPGEMVVASLDGLNKVCDAVEVAGKNVMSTSSTVTTGLVSHKYGEEAGKATNEGLDAAGHAIGTAWTVFKFRKALNPKSILKPSALAKSAAAEIKSKKPK